MSRAASRRHDSDERPPQAAYDEDNFENYLLDLDWDGEACEDFFDEPAEGDKCGGYGHYPQAGEPRCARPGCNKGQLVFQLESSWGGILDNTYFGDNGKLFVYICTEHGEPQATGHIEYY